MVRHLFVSVAVTVIPCGCLLLQERPRTDECVTVSVELPSSSSAEVEVIDIPEERELFACSDAAGGTTEVPSVIIDLYYDYGYGSDLVRAVDDGGRTLPIALLSPTCDQTIACSEWVDERVQLAEGLDSRSFLVVQPLPTSNTIRLQVVDANYCPTSYDDVCDEPDRCAPGTDEYDCE